MTDTDASGPDPDSGVGSDTGPGPGPDTGPDLGRSIRETYEEYDLDGARVAMIADPENEHAWIQSDRPSRVTR